MTEQWEYLVETWRQQVMSAPTFTKPRPVDLDVALGKWLTAKGRERWEPISFGPYDGDPLQEVTREVVFRRSTARRT